MDENETTVRENTTSVFEIPSAVLKHSEAAKEQLDRLTTQKPNQLTPKEADFVLIVLELAAQKSPSNATVQIPYTELQTFVMRKNALTNDKSQKRSIHRSSIVRRMNSLTQLGLFSAMEMDNVSGGKPPKLYRLQSIHEPTFNTTEHALYQEASQGRGTQRRTNIGGALRELKRSDAQLVKEISQTRARSDSLFTGILDRGMRFSTREAIPGNEIIVKMRVKKAHLTVMATAHHQLAALSDQRVIRACVTCIAHIIDTKLDEYKDRREAEILRRTSKAPSVTYDVQGGLFTPIPSEWDGGEGEDALSLTNAQVVLNEFMLDSVDLAKVMNYKSPHSSTTRKLVNASLRRLADTNFRLYISNPDSDEAKEVMELFGLDDTAMDFRFIQDLKSQHHLSESETPSKPGTALGPVSDNDADPFREDELKRVRLWKVSIDSHLYYRLLDKNTRRLYLAHPEIMSESSGLAQSIYNFMSSIIGRKNPELCNEPERIYSKPLRVLHNTLWPNRRYDRFQKDLVEILRIHAKRKGVPFDSSLKKNVVPVFGFIFDLSLPKDKTDLHIRVSRDTTDPLTGNKSFHNLKRKQDKTDQAELEFNTKTGGS
jgi:hypothetical protein